ncbi:MAG: DUF1080 domain-containing protein, partial [Verrucomicrobiota bacterium]
MRNKWKTTIFAVSAITLSFANTACGQDTKHNTLSEAEKKAGWKLLFDGKKIEDWRGYDKMEISDDWLIEGDTLKKVANSRGANIMTVDTYENFEFSWEWKILKNGNNGVKYFITEER